VNNYPAWGPEQAAIARQRQYAHPASRKSGEPFIVPGRRASSCDPGCSRGAILRSNSIFTQHPTWMVFVTVPLATRRGFNSDQLRPRTFSELGPHRMGGPRIIATEAGGSARSRPSTVKDGPEAPHRR